VVKNNYTSKQQRISEQVGSGYIRSGTFKHNTLSVAHLNNKHSIMENFNAGTSFPFQPGRSLYPSNMHHINGGIQYQGVKQVRNPSCNKTQNQITTPSGHYSIKDVTVILPAFKEEVSIGSMVLHTRKYAGREIVVDDGSNDRTAEFAELAGAEVIKHAENRGKGAALKTGFEAAACNGTKVILTMDGKHDPGEISKLAAPILSDEADVVNGSRYIQGNKNNLTSKQISDHFSGFRAFSHNCINYFNAEESIFDNLAERGFTIKEVSIDSNRPVNKIVAMPAYNEQHTIAYMISACNNYADKVVVVDDGSTDETARIAEENGAYVVRHRQNRGYGAALKSCFETAREIGAEKMVIIDSDGQHDPAEIPKLLEPLNNGADLVIGSRFLNGNGKNIPAYRKVGMKVLDIATNFTGGINVSDSQSGYRAYSKKAIEKIKIKGRGMSAGSEVLMQAKDHDLKFKEVEIHCSYDVENVSSQNPVSHGVKVLIQILSDMELRRPLYYFTVPGLIMASIGFVLGLSFLKTFYLGGGLPFGPTLLMMLLTIVGTFSVFTGIMLHSMSKLMNFYNSR